jgi:hypothetical protein
MAGTEIAYDDYYHHLEIPLSAFPFNNLHLNIPSLKLKILNTNSLNPNLVYEPQ